MRKNIPEVSALMFVYSTRPEHMHEAMGSIFLGIHGF